MVTTVKPPYTNITERQSVFIMKVNETWSIINNHLQYVYFVLLS